MLNVIWRNAALTAFGASMLLSPAVHATIVVEQMFVFGDSLSDPGNAAALTTPDPTVLNQPASFFPPSQPNRITPSPSGIPYDYRFSNGPTAMEQLAGLLNIAPSAPAYVLPSNPNFAVGGAMTGPGPVDPTLPGITGAGLCCNYNWIVDSPTGLRTGITGVPQGFPAVAGTGINNQIDLFASRLGKKNGVPLFNPSTALFSVWGGPNDIFLALALAPPDQLGVVLQAYALKAAKNINNDISDLADLGAQNFLVPNMPNLGKTPLALILSAQFGTDFTGILTGISWYFNEKLQDYLAQLREHRPGLEIIEFDTFNALDELIDSGKFDITQQPCLDTTNPPKSVSDTLPNVLGGCPEYLFFDSVHPTVATAGILAQEFLVALPEPNALALLAAALIAFAWFGAVRKSR